MVLAALLSSTALAGLSKRTWGQPRVGVSTYRSTTICLRPRSRTSAFARTDFPLEDDTIRAQASSQGILTSRLVGSLYAGDFTFEVHPGSR